MGSKITRNGRFDMDGYSDSECPDWETSDDGGAFERRLADTLVMVSRLALLDVDGPPVTHICGVRVENVRHMAESAATGINTGSNLGMKYPWGNRR